jgi:hypothetical protein
MITRKTVFILGAGASAPYGFPLGRALLLDVAYSLQEPEGYLSSTLSECGFDRGSQEEFRNALKLSMLPSIDLFLEYRREFLSIGKFAIAISLIRLEDSLVLQRRGNLKWYEYMYNQVVSGATDISQSKLKFITFNYDRSLEHFFHLALKHTLNVDGTDWKRQMENVPIVHVYGQLGEYPQLFPSGREYANTTDATLIKKCTEAIKIASEGETETDEFALAKSFIEEAEVICFLGFSYHPVNLRRLGMPSILGPRQNVLGCAYGLTPAEQSQVKAGFLRNIEMGKESQDSLEFLRTYDVLR